MNAEDYEQGRVYNVGDLVRTPQGVFRWSGLQWEAETQEEKAPTPTPPPGEAKEEKGVTASSNLVGWGVAAAIFYFFPLEACFKGFGFFVIIPLVFLGAVAYGVGGMLMGGRNLVVSAITSAIPGVKK